MASRKLKLTQVTEDDDSDGMLELAQIITGTGNGNDEEANVIDNITKAVGKRHQDYRAHMQQISRGNRYEVDNIVMGQSAKEKSVAFDASVKVKALPSVTSSPCRPERVQDTSKDTREIVTKQPKRVGARGESQEATEVLAAKKEVVKENLAFTHEDEDEYNVHRAYGKFACRRQEGPGLLMCGVCELDEEA